jgi:hypothetical protein
LEQSINMWVGLLPPGFRMLMIEAGILEDGVEPVSPSFIREQLRMTREL